VGDELRLLLEEGEPLEVEVRGETVQLEIDQEVVMSVPSRWLDPSELPPRTPVPAKRMDA
jgi:hypothetical protein